MVEGRILLSTTYESRISEGKTKSFFRSFKGLQLRDPVQLGAKFLEKQKDVSHLRKSIEDAKNKK